MKILVSNDDGYKAEGIHALRERLKRDGHDVYLVAPSDERSASSQAITWRNPLSVHKLDDRTWHLSGTPADCVKFALFEICPDVDIVLSGINSGPNCGVDTLYSGTVGAAMEAVVLGKPAIAVSRDVFLREGKYISDERYEASAEYAARLIAYVAENPLPKGVMFNLNVPALPVDEVRGLKLAPLGTTSYGTGFEKISSGWLGDWYFIKPDGEFIAQPGSDRALLNEGYAVATFLSWSYEIKPPFTLPEDL